MSIFPVLRSSITSLALLMVIATPVNATVTTIGDADNSWCYDGLDNESPGETIWKYELPAESIVTESSDFDSTEALKEAVAAHPKREIKVTPACKFRSRC